MLPAAFRLPGLALSLLLVGSPTAAQVPDPFAPGTRWRFSPPAGKLWIPRALSFAAAGELVWTGVVGKDPGLALLATSTATPVASPLFSADSALSGALGPILVEAGPGPGELFALVQLPDPDAAHRRTLVARHDALAAARGGGFTPLWTRALGFSSNAPAALALSADGSVVLVAAFDPARSAVQLDWLDPADGSCLRSATLAGNSARALELSGDGARTALIAGTRVYVLGGSGEVLLERSLVAASPALALSRDGRVLAHGELSSVWLLEEQGGAYRPFYARQGGPSELAVALALSGDGSTLASTWWDYASGTRVRLEVLDPRTGALLNAYEQAGAPPGLQNFPSALAMTSDGERIALGLWGASDPRPECLLFRRAVAGALLAVDLPGSVEALALEEGGTRLAVASRDAHANRFSASGVLQLLDTGERDLQLLASARPGSTLELALRTPVPARAALFAVGFLRSAPVAAWGGSLWLDLSLPHAFRLGIVLGPERVEATLALPPDPDLIGLGLGIQAVVISDAGLRLAETLVRPIFL